MKTMKLRKGFITHMMGEEQLMVAAGPASKLFHGMVRSNATAAMIVDCLKTPVTEKALVDAILSRYETDRTTVEADVRAILDKLRSIGALDE